MYHTGTQMSDVVAKETLKSETVMEVKDEESREVNKYKSRVVTTV